MNDFTAYLDASGRRVHRCDDTCIHGPDFPTLNRAAAAEMALRQQEAGRKREYEQAIEAQVRDVAALTGVPGAVLGRVDESDPLLIRQRADIDRAFRHAYRSPGEATVDTRRWMVGLSASPSYPGLRKTGRRIPFRSRRLPEPPQWFRATNIASAIFACMVGLQSPFVVHAGSPVAYWVSMGLLIPGSGMLVAWLAGRGRHAE